MALPDGGPLSKFSREQGYVDAARVTGPDLMKEMLKESADKHYRHYFYGSTQETLDILKATIEKNYPGAVIAGMYSPPFRPLTPEEDAAVIRRINETKPDFVWVGLGAPKQERWMAAHRYFCNLIVEILIFLQGVQHQPHGVPRSRVQRGRRAVDIAASQPLGSKAAHFIVACVVPKFYIQVAQGAGLARFALHIDIKGQVAVLPYIYGCVPCQCAAALGAVCAGWVIFIRFPQHGFVFVCIHRRGRHML